MAKLSRKETVLARDDSVAQLAARVEFAARSLLALSVRASENLPDSVSPTQLRALTAAQDLRPCSLAALADSLGITTSSGSRLVDRLAAAGLLDRRTSDGSRREVVLRVTPAGRRLLQRHGDTATRDATSS